MLTNRTDRAQRLLLVLVVVLLLGTFSPSDAGALELGKPAPDFALPGTNGDTVSLRQFRGKKIVLLEFFGAAFAPV